MSGHFARQFPNQQSAPGLGNQSWLQGQQSYTYGMVNHMATEEAHQAQDVVLGVFLASSHPTTVLFDLGASHSFISSASIAKYHLPMSIMKHTMLVNSLGGEMRTQHICLVISVTIRGVNHRHGTTVEFPAVMTTDQTSMLNHLHGNSLEEIWVVQEYPDAFPEELPSMPPDHDIVFIIDLLLGTPPISKRPYRTPINELEELKKQIAEMQSKGFICPSSSLWRAPMLFVEKKDGTQWMWIDYCWRS
jgi:hypothetical protein